MGQSDTIKDKRASNKEFREFMNELEADSKVEEERLLGKIIETAKRQYEGNGWDYARLFGDKRSDYQNYSDWNLNRVTNIINSIGGALTGSDFPSKEVPGSEGAAKGTVDNAKEFISAFSGDYSLVIARVTAMMTSVLSQFAVASDAKRNSVEQDLPLSGGMHLFFACTGNVFKRDTFFTNQFIGSFQIVFETYMSVAEAKAIGLQQILKTTAAELDILNADLLYFRQLQSESIRKVAKESPEDFLSTKQAYDLMIEAQKADIAMLFSEYNQYIDVVETVDQFFPTLDLSEFGRKSLSDNPMSLEHLFTEREISIARRYINERLNS